MATTRIPRDPEDKRVRVIARTVRSLLLEHELMLKELDEMSGQAPGYSSQVLTGNVRMTFHHVFRWLDALEIPPEEFFRRLATAIAPKPRPRNQPPSRKELDELVRRVAAELERRSHGTGLDNSPGRPEP